MHGGYSPTGLRAPDHVTGEQIGCTAATHSGPTGRRAPDHVTGEQIVVIDPVPVLLLLTVEKTVVDWDKLQNRGNVIEVNAQVNMLFCTVSFVSLLITLRTVI